MNFTIREQHEIMLAIVTRCDWLIEEATKENYSEYFDLKLKACHDVYYRINGCNYSSYDKYLVDKKQRFMMSC